MPYGSSILIPLRSVGWSVSQLLVGWPVHNKGCRALGGSLQKEKRQLKGKKLNYKLRVIHMQKGILFVFANNLDGVLVWNYVIGGFKKGEWRERLSFPPVFMS